VTSGNRTPLIQRASAVDPETPKITDLVNQPNTESFVSGTVAIPIGNDLWVRGDRIATFPASK
jgi:hypothetical protein